MNIVRLIILAEDDSTIVRDDVSYSIDESAIGDANMQELQAEKTIVIGWNTGAPLIVRELDQYIEAVRPHPSGSPSLSRILARCGEVTEEEPTGLSESSTRAPAWITRMAS